MEKEVGKIIVPGDVNVWPHEYQTALVLAKAGFIVEVIRKSTRDHEHSADVIIDGVKWEMKCPKSGSIKAVERNLKRAQWQSENIIFDSRRMKKIPDKVVERELTNRSKELVKIKRLLFVNRHGILIDIA